MSVRPSTRLCHAVASASPPCAEMGSKLGRLSDRLEGITDGRVEIRAHQPYPGETSAVDHPLHGLWIAIALHLHAG